MREACPECGSGDIVSDLVVFSDDSLCGQQPPYVQLLEPKPEKAPFLWSPKRVTPASMRRSAARADSRASTRSSMRRYSKRTGTATPANGMTMRLPVCRPHDTVSLTARALSIPLLPDAFVGPERHRQGLRQHGGQTMR